MTMDHLNVLAVAPELTLLVGTGVVLVADLFTADAQRNRTYVLALIVLALVALECASGLAGEVVAYAFNGMYVTDPMADLLKLVSCLCTAAALIYAQVYARDRGLWRGELFTLGLFVLLGVLVMISANNLLVIYLGLELQALALYALTALRRDDARATEAAMKYFVLGALASGFLLYGMSMLYGAVGTLDLNAIAHGIGGAAHGVRRPALVLGTVFIVCGLGFKLGAVPFHMWLPDVYQGSPTPVTLLIAAAPKLAAFAIAFRLLVEGLLPLAFDWQQMVLVLAVASLALGNLTAVAQTNLKRMLGYSTIGQIGFLLLAMRSGVLGGNTLATANAYSAGLFYAITYVLTTLGTFGIVLLLSRAGFEAEEIADLRGLNRRSPWYAFVMALLMLSLAGVPPTVGFHAKLVVLQAVLGDGMSGAMIWLAVIAVLFSLVGAFYYLRVIKVMYFDEPADQSPIVASTDMRVALSLNGVAIMGLSFAPQILLAACGRAMIRTLGG
jgi:NADH-quinone oxidoreductase subunit N